MENLSMCGGGVADAKVSTSGGYNKTAVPRIVLFYLLISFEMYHSLPW